MSKKPSDIIAEWINNRDFDLITGDAKLLMIRADEVFVLQEEHERLKKSIYANTGVSEKTWDTLKELRAENEKFNKFVRILEKDAKALKEQSENITEFGLEYCQKLRFEANVLFHHLNKLKKS